MSPIDNDFDASVDYVNKRADDAINAGKTGYAPNFTDVMVRRARSIPNGDPLSVAAPYGGYFVIGDREVGSERAYTRDGTFRLDRDGLLTNAAGAYVMGFRAGGLDGRTLKPLQLPPELRGKENIAGAIRPDGTFVAVRTDVAGDPGVPVGRIALARFPAGRVMRAEGDGSTLHAPGEAPMIAEPGTSGTAVLTPGARDIGTVDRLAAIRHLSDASTAMSAQLQAAKAQDVLEKKAEDLNK